MHFFSTLLKVGHTVPNSKQHGCENFVDGVVYEEVVHTNDIIISTKSDMEVVDFQWLSPQLVERFNVLGYDKVWFLNNDFDLETGVIAGCNEYRISQSFTESLYLLYMFLNGHLFGSPVGHKVSFGYFGDMHDVLLQLCIHGVYTVEGVTHVIGKVPSQCAFVVLIRDEVMIPFIDFMESMYHKGMNVNARQIKNGKVVLQYNKVKDFRTLKKFTVDTSIICERFTSLGGIGTRDDIVTEETFSMFSLWHLKVWNQSIYEGMCVEDLMLHLWIKFNSIYGFVNYDMFVM